MWNKLKSYFQTPEMKEKEEDDTSCVGEPILSFVKCVKATPRRFRCREIRSLEFGVKYAWQKEGKFYKIFDRKTGHCFPIMYLQGRLYEVKGVDFETNWYEQRYLHDQLSPIFLARVERKQSLDYLPQERKRLEKIETEKALRAKWMEVYQ